ncbi:Protein of unknown function [Lentzea xinjiangensis]|uniref:DUF664 domain-containing protein n=2 Tax=Lentzea xinjiangensis TaxID=402600 RepID=A0A1H9K853_9PSEU|nr:Protein of unknown function [Lentzea xinjiangensis]
MPGGACSSPGSGGAFSLPERRVPVRAGSAPAIGGSEAAAAVPSGTAPLGLVKHLTSVERATFLGEEVSAAGVVDAYREAVRRANGVLDEHTDPAAPVPRPGRPAPSLRWALAHMLEENGRHTGHADILREFLDGRTGR